MIYRILISTMIKVAELFDNNQLNTSMPHYNNSKP